MSFIVIWHHLGREHGGLDYAEDILNNPPEVIQQYQTLKEEWIKDHPTTHHFFQYDTDTLVEYSNEEDSIIIYMKEKGLQLSLHAKSKSKYPWWVIDIVDIVEVKPGVYFSYDLFIDIKVFEDLTYHVIDIDDFEEAIELGVLTKAQIQKTLRAFHLALTELNKPGAGKIIETAERIRAELVNQHLLKD